MQRDKAKRQKQEKETRKQGERISEALVGLGPNEQNTKVQQPGP